MVFASSQFLNVPWETIIKQYRRELGDHSFPTLAEQADHFLNYFNGQNGLFPPDAQERSVAVVTEALCSAVIEDAQPRLEERETAGEDLTQEAVVEEIEESIADHLKRWKDAGKRDDLPNDYRERVRKKYASSIEDTISAIAENAGLSDKAKSALIQSVPWYLECADFLWRNPLNSGIVIAGFGRDDVFPRLRRFQFQTIAADRLKFKEGEAVSIGHDNRAVISAFARARASVYGALL